MITPFMVYLIGIASNVQVILITVFICVLLSLIVVAVWWLAEEDSREKSQKCLFRVFIFTVISGVLAALMPSSSTVAAMIVIPKVVNNEKIQNITENSLNILQSLSVKWLEDLTKAEKKVEK
jgi:RsiW-degrading membrane proteinase PrsW (M82 family)